ncbi:MAG: DUF4080 domain-containing protein, partial [Armatimonadetes bacterium]|nr:DUF4080 domain-containing protein [Armatimonadota bacterium]
NYRKLEENLRFLRQETGVHVHADLIAGLPGEDLESFGRGFDRLLELGPQEIQVGLLKRLRGTPIAVHDREWTMAYSPAAPYEVLKTRVLSFRDVQRLRRFSRYWDLVGNRGFFQETLPVLLRVDGSPFRSFMRFSDWLFENEQATHRIALLRLTELLFRYLAARGQDAQALAGALFRDYSRDKKRAVPPFLAEHLARPIPLETVPQASIPARQARHLAGSRTENRHPSPG